MKKLLKILGASIALVILVALTIPLFISSDFLKSQLTAQVKKATGRTLDIKGETSLRLFPAIAVRAQDVTLGNPAGFESAFLVHIDKLETGVALMPLLSKQLHITGITLDGATVNLEQNSAGVKNWEFAKAAPSAAGNDAGAAKKSAPSAVRGFALGDVSISGSAVTYNMHGAKTIAASEINLTIKGADGASPLAVDGHARYQGEPVKVRARAESIKSMLVGTPGKLELKLEMPSATAEFNGTGALKPEGGAEANGHLDLAIGSLPALLTWANGIPPAGTLPKQIDLAADITMQGTQSIALTNLAATIDRAKAEGKLMVNLAGSVPALKGALHVGELDLDAFKSAEAADAESSVSADASASAPQGWSESRLDLSGLRAVNAALDLKVEAIRAGTFAAEDIALNLALRQGVLTLNLAKAALYQGTAKGVVTLDGSSAGAGITADITVDSVNIDTLMTALSGASRLEGKANLALDLRGSGMSERSIVGALGGNGRMRVVDGAVKGVNIAQLLRDAKKGFLFSESTSRSTDFTELTASFTMAQGVLTNKDLFMKSPALRLAGAGTANLPNRTLQYKLTPTIAGTSKGQGGKDQVGGLAIPLLIFGPWSNPSVTPDVAGMVRDGLKNPEALKQNIKDISSQIKNLNSPKDIGRALFGGEKKEAAPAAPAQ